MDMGFVTPTPGIDTGIFPDTSVNIMLPDALAPCAARTLDTMAFTMLDLNPLHAQFFKGTKTYIYILCHCSTLTWHK